MDTRKAQPGEVKRFLRAAFYRRFGLSPSPELVQLHPGGGAVGVRLNRFDTLGQAPHDNPPSPLSSACANLSLPVLSYV